MIGSRLIKSNDVAAGCEDIVNNYDPFGGNGVALYQLNGNANDVSGNYNGTATNVTYGTGVFGQAGVFNGSSSYVNLNSSVISANSSFSISHWVKFDTLANGVGNRSIHIGNSDDASGISIFGFNGVIYLRIVDNSGTPRDITNSFSINVWYNLVITYDNASKQFKGYVNNVLINTLTITGFNPLANYGAIGSRIGSGGANQFLDGSVDQVRIFNTALTPLEVEALYTEELCICGGTVDTLDILNDSSCIALYPLDGNANDLSGNYSGTPTNVSYGVGEFDLAGVFNGSSSEINYPLLNGFLNTKTTVSVSLWFKCSTQAETGTLFSDYAGYSFNVYLAIDVNGKISGATRYSGNTLEMPASSNSYDDNSWHNIVVVIDQNSNIRKHYVDGIEVNSETMPSGSWNGDANQKVTSGVLFYTIGSFNQNKFNGSIDQVRIFNKALSAGEVTTLYNETACTPAACTSGTTNTLNILGDGSCIATYPLDGSPLDLSGNYNGVQTDVTYPQGEFNLAGNFKALQGNIVTPVGVYSNSFSGHSVSFWMYSGGTNYETPIWTRTADIVAAGWGIRVGIGGNSLTWFWQNTANNFVFVAEISGTFTDGWHHVVASWDGTTNTNGAKLYVDGNLSSQLTANATLASQTFSLGLTLGADRQSAGRSILGLDQVRIFNKALSASEVTTLYNETPCN